MHIKPKKKLGQNFLVDRNIQRKIVSAIALAPESIVLEIGAGRGELTLQIAPEAHSVYALELDRRLIGPLKSSLKGLSRKVEVINQDVLKFDLASFFEKTGKKIIVIGNIPYYISSAIIEQIIKHRRVIDCAYFTVQKEFAARVTAESGGKDFGSLSCFVKYYTEPEIIFPIRRTSFFPVPKVDSSFLRLKIRQEPPVAVVDEEFFFSLIRTAFQQRRKMLKNSLAELCSKEKMDAFFATSKVNERIRPEQLSLENFARLANSLSHP